MLIHTPSETLYLQREYMIIQCVFLPLSLLDMVSMISLYYHYGAGSVVLVHATDARNFDIVVM